jgi:hypothetical protein
MSEIQYQLPLLLKNIAIVAGVFWLLWDPYKFVSAPLLKRSNLFAALVFTVSAALIFAWLSGCNRPWLIFLLWEAEWTVAGDVAVIFASLSFVLLFSTFRKSTNTS